MSRKPSTPHPIKAIASRQQARIEAHEKLRQSQPYLDATMRIQRLTLDFVETVRAAWFFTARDPNSSKYVFWRFTDDLLGSALAIWMASREGIDTVPRRELRFMLELAIRNAYVDLVYASAETSLDTRMAYVEHKLEGDIVLLDELPLTIYWADPSLLKNEVKERLYGELSKYVHPSHEQMERRLALADRGVFLGFETATELEAFADLLLRTYDVLLAIVFLELGPSSTSDLLPLFTERPQWSFSTSRFIPEIVAELSRS
jgi:hypothetical protein